MILTGPVTNLQRESAQWTIPVAQYCMGKSRQPLRTTVKIPDIPGRWTTGKKPIPFEPSVVAVSGTVTEVQKPEPASSVSTPGLTISMETIAFVGRPNQSVIPSSLPIGESVVIISELQLMVKCFGS